MPGEDQYVEPVLHVQDGSFIGFHNDDFGQIDMAAFNGGGGLRWMVPNDYPLIATADGGVSGSLDSPTIRMATRRGKLPIC
jgi:hypothetical protein